MRLIDADELKIYKATHPELIMAIEEAPTIEPPRGEWISLEPEIGLFECSKCGHRILRAECNFCPHCGADMRKKVF